MGVRALSVLARPRAECSVLVVDDSAIAELNRAYRRVAGPTDVLAFPMTEGRFGKAWPDLLGDVVISAETARRQARVRKADLRAELALLLVHGILHLVGYDHGTAEERRRMWHKQRTILAACGIQASAAVRAIRAPAGGRPRAARPAPGRRRGE